MKAEQTVFPDTGATITLKPHKSLPHYNPGKNPTAQKKVVGYTILLWPAKSMAQTGYSFKEAANC